MAVDTGKVTPSRDSIRSSILGKKPKFAKEIVEYKNNRYEIRQPTLRARREIMNRCTGNDGTIDMMSALIYLCIYNTYIADTDERVFEESDYEALLEEPTGGFIDEISIIASSLMNLEASAKAKKN